MRGQEGCTRDISISGPAGMGVRGLSRQSTCQMALHMSQRSIFSSSKGLWHTWHYVSSEGRLAGEERRDGTGPGEVDGWCLEK